MNNNSKVTQLISTMTLAEKVGQLFVLAFAGHDIDYAKQLVKSHHVGGFYITDDNAATPKDAKTLADELQHQAQLRACDAPLLLCVDQEGSWGILAKHTDLGPGNLALGKANKAELTEQMYQVFAEQMHEIGYNTLLSPCSDVNTNPNNPIIGLRSFGEMPKQVATHVAAAVRGIKRGGNLATAKHFPGHGDTHSDSHQCLPTVDKTLSELQQGDLLPFQAAIDAGVSLIMTSHICFPQLDDTYPATLSSKILTNLLQQQMGFNGLIITDSMNMWAMRKNYQPAEAAILALKAGAHLVMLSEEHYENSATDYKALQLATLNGVIHAVESGQLDEAVINERLHHVLSFKYDKLNVAKTPEHLTADDIEALIETAVSSSVSVLRNEVGNWPLTGREFTLTFAAHPKKYDSLVNSRGIGPNDPRSAKDTIIQGLQQRTSKVNLLPFDEFLTLLEGCDETISTPLVIVTEDYPLPGESFDVAEQKQLVQRALKRFGKQVVVIAMRSDYELTDYAELATYICAYSSRVCAAKYIASLL
ncbi:glycoside hydrolase family 3 protein [Pseudoalteromonas spongiae]|uniref:glycoside hydrolase family 3 protein n=1 Tax=Pseudoalteromonas spongiae TaxID=298657 RepID=UPI00110B0BA7|nr:glycoside hydrolase family 3 N-terminal domain-containing protein [Pseudoalteromonas spongiae]TMO84344.1 beta-glucosidase [Pseudoalteromonas spongiae]